MPVYFCTVHSYRSWREDDAAGYAQHGQGIQLPDENRATTRSNAARQPETRFSLAEQESLHVVSNEIAAERALQLYATTTTPTHLHVLGGFESPKCECGASPGCGKTCPAQKHVIQFITRLKRIAGLRLAQVNEIRGRVWFSRGWNVQPVRGREHFSYLMETYLPKHADESGIVRIYR